MPPAVLPAPAKNFRQNSQQEFRHDREHNNDGEYVDQTARVRDTRPNRLAEETEQPIHGQDQDD
jgi:hypothetical protein